MMDSGRERNSRLGGAALVRLHGGGDGPHPSALGSCSHVGAPGRGGSSCCYGASVLGAAAGARSCPSCWRPPGREVRWPETALWGIWRACSRSRRKFCGFCRCCPTLKRKWCAWWSQRWRWWLCSRRGSSCSLSARGFETLRGGNQPGSTRGAFGIYSLPPLLLPLLHLCHLSLPLLPPPHPALQTSCGALCVSLRCGRRLHDRARAPSERKMRTDGNPEWLTGIRLQETQKQSDTNTQNNFSPWWKCCRQYRCWTGWRSRRRRSSFFRCSPSSYSGDRDCGSSASSASLRHLCCYDVLKISIHAHPKQQKNV